LILHFAGETLLLAAHALGGGWCEVTMSTRPNSDSPRLADLIIKAGRIYAIDERRSTFRSLAVREGRIVAASDEPDGLDALASSETAVLEDPELTVLPAFFDIHEHLLDSARNLGRVRLENARSMAELVAMIAERAQRIPEGEWVQTSNGWNESNLAEGRLPTADELDQATRTHPVLAPRGGHVSITNTLGLEKLGITSETPAPPGGTIGRLDDGTPNGLLEGSAAQMIKALVPPPPPEESVQNLTDACGIYAALGVGSVREALLLTDGWEVYQSAWEQGRLSIRCLPMLLVDSSWPPEQRLAFVDGLRVRSGFGDDWLRLWGLKFVLDGGVAGAGMEEPFANNPSYTGHLNWDPDEMTEVVAFALSRNWKVATHAVGDRTVRTVLDVYERALEQHPGKPPGTLVIEHAFLADREQRARAIRLGVAITVQHALLYTNGGEILASWGPGRASRVMPVRSWLADGAMIAAGTDQVRPSNPMLNVWGMVTRGTKDAGFQGRDEAIDTYTAIELYTAAGTRLTGEADRRGQLKRGQLADFVAYRANPMSTPPDELPDLKPVLTCVGGRGTYDPEKLLAPCERMEAR
jgi:predicted amidohydrolase YtcJ